MFSLSLWRGSRSGSSERTTSTSGSANQNTSEASWTPYGKSSASPCKSTLLACSALPETKRLVVQTAVSHLFKQTHFSICDLRNVMEIVGARKGSEAYKLLQNLHCVDYDKMPPELRERIPHLVNECLRQQDDVIEATSVALEGVRI